MYRIKISIIVPAYNVAPWLPRCIESVLAQTHTNWELLLIDDGSTDETPQIIDHYANQDKRIIAIHQKNAGLVEVREVGLSLASGEYVGFIDGDDAIDPHMYQQLLANALKYNADISHCNFRVCYNGTNDTPALGTNKIIVHSSIEAIQALLSGAWLSPSLGNKLYKKELLYNSCLDKMITSNEDLLRNFTLFQRAQRVVHQDFPGYQYWSRENSLSNDAQYIKRMCDILTARHLILNHAAPEIYPHAMRLWLSTFVNIIQETIYTKDPDLISFSQKCRQTLKKERKNIRYLIPRQRIAAYLILYFPALHRFVYSLYKR